MHSPSSSALFCTVHSSTNNTRSEPNVTHERITNVVALSCMHVYSGSIAAAHVPVQLDERQFKILAPSEGGLGGAPLGGIAVLGTAVVLGAAVGGDESESAKSDSRALLVSIHCK